MQTKRTIGSAPRTTALALDISHLNTPCIGCTDCQGICAVLIETMQLPELLLRNRAA